MISLALSFDDVLLKPQHSPVASRSTVDVAPNPLCGFRFSHPILSANMATVTEEAMMLAMHSTGGLGVLHRMQTIEEQTQRIRSVHEIDTIAFSVGVKMDDMSRAIKSFNAGGDLCFLDVAHADSHQTLEFVKMWFQDSFFKSKPLVIGQVATPLAIHNFLTNIPEGMHHKIAFKIGIGGGSMCTTRIETGSGMPTFQSILDCNEVFLNRSFALIADGGIKNSGDIVKALAAGADYVMIGSLLAGTIETPGSIILGKDKKKYKIYRGSASYADKQVRGEQSVHLEGTETLVDYKGSTESVITHLLDGIRSGCSYNGVSTVRALSLDPQFVQITSQGLHESGAHGA